MSDEIRINTDSLRSYAGQLDSIQRQIYALNAEIRSFRYHTGKLYNVNVYGYEGTINAAKSYCVDTAKEFDDIERYLQGCDPEKYEGNIGWLRDVYCDNRHGGYDENVDASSKATASVSLSTTGKSKTTELVKGLLGNIPIVGGVIGLANDMCSVKWQEEVSLSGKVAAFNSGLAKVGSGFLSFTNDTAEFVDKQIKAVQNGYCTSKTCVRARWKEDLLGLGTDIVKSTKLQQFEYVTRTTFTNEFATMFKPEKTVFGKVECLAKWAGFAAEYLGYYKDDKDKYGTWGGVVSSVSKAAIKTTWDIGVKSVVAGALALTPIGGSAIAVGVAATVVGWGIDYGINKLSGGEYEGMGDFISKNVDDGVEAIVDTYKATKKVAKKVANKAKSVVKNANKAVANWWKDTKKSLSFGF